MSHEIISINASVKYDIHIGFNGFECVGSFLKSLNVSKSIIVSDSNVFPLYGAALEKSLTELNIVCDSFVFLAGEQSKNIQSYAELLSFLAMQNLSRDGFIIALGGGVTGDLAGFAAATYLRGIRYIQIPTTLLAAVDSSVGGKTGIDLPAGKNLAGAFWQPSMVVCDSSLMKTLPVEEIYNGAAEVIKYGCIKDAELFWEIADGSVMRELALQKHTGKNPHNKEKISSDESFSRDFEKILARCIRIKQACVEEDEFDRGVRALLNFGHTFGHAIEKLSGYQIAHGKAVAMGMVMAARISERIGFSTESCVKPLTDALTANGLESRCPAFEPEAIAKAAAQDKKRSGDHITLVLMKSIGNCALYQVRTEKLPSLIHMGLSE